MESPSSGRSGMAEFEVITFHTGAVIREESEDRFIAVDPSRPSRRRRSKDRSCSECKASKTPIWRRGSSGSMLCNRCGLQDRRVKKKLASIDCYPSASIGLPFGSANVSFLPVTEHPGNDHGRGYVPESEPPVYQVGERSVVECSQGESSLSSINEEILTDPSPFEAHVDLSSGTPQEISVYSNQTTALFLAESVLGDQMTQLPRIDETYLSAIQAPSHTGSSHRNAQTCPRVMIEHTLQNTAPTAPEFGSWPPDITAGLFNNQTVVPHNRSDGGAFQCRCSICLCHLFSVAGCMPSDNLIIGPQHWLSQFYRRATDVHFDALQQGSSVYVATETFVYEYAGKTWKLTAFAVLREQYDVISSPSIGFSSISASQAAQNDLVFDFVGVPTTDSPNQLNQLDDWLDGQSLVKHIESSRAMSAIWDLSRLPVGRHHPSSATFRYLRRSFHTVETSLGSQTTPKIISGNPVHNFRSVHQITMLLKHVRSDARMEIFRSLEPILRNACIRSCQEWFIACLDEAAKRRDTRAQLDFLEANKEYMQDTIILYRLSFQEICVDDIPHICSVPCSSHVQPSFDGLVSAAKKALDKLFSRRDVLHYTQSTSPRLITQDQFLNAQTVGYVQYKLCFSCHLLNDEQREQHNGITWKKMAEERVKLLRRSKAMFVWNYLPVDVIEMASAKLDRILASFHFPSRFFICT